MLLFVVCLLFVCYLPVDVCCSWLVDVCCLLFFVVCCKLLGCLLFACLFVCRCLLFVVAVAVIVADGYSVVGVFVISFRSSV